MLVETNHEGNTEDEKHPTVGHEPHPLLVLQVGELGHDHDGEYPHDHPLGVADTEEEHNVSLLLGGGAAGLGTGAELRIRVGRHTHDQDDECFRRLFLGSVELGMTDFKMREEGIKRFEIFNLVYLHIIVFVLILNYLFIPFSLRKPSVLLMEILFVHFILFIDYLVIDYSYYES